MAEFDAANIDILMPDDVELILEELSATPDV